MTEQKNLQADVLMKTYLKRVKGPFFYNATFLFRAYFPGTVVCLITDESQVINYRSRMTSFL